MKLFVLTCINEALEVVEQSIHTTFLEAAYKMQDEFERERSAMVDENGAEFIVQDDIFGESATIVYGSDPQQYEWVIRQVEA